MSEEFVNPIDEDKVVDNPGLLPFAHHVGSAIIRPIDKGKVKGLGMSAMYEQTEDQLVKIKEQVAVLIKQAQEIHDRISLSEIIYKADCGFKPRIGQHYHLYQRAENSYFISMIGQSEWGKSSKLIFQASITLLHDHTWKVVDTSDTFKDFQGYYAESSSTEEEKSDIQI